MKKYVLIFLLLFVLLVPAAAAAENNIRVLINGQECYFDHSPVIDNGRTLVPMRAFFESLGADVHWEPETNTAIAIRGGVEIRIIIGSSTPMVNGMETMINVPARLINETTFIPLRFIGEALDHSVSWEPLNRKITIETGIGDVEKAENVSTFKVIFSQMGMASWYGSKFAGRPTASGEVFNPQDFTGAHRELAFSTYVKVTFLKTGKSVLVRINDRGPHRDDRVIDLSQAAAEAIGLKACGIGDVLLEVLE
jgi:hypothetical protein